MESVTVEMFRKPVNLRNCVVFKFQVSLFPCHRQDDFLIVVRKMWRCVNQNPWGKKEFTHLF